MTPLIESWPALAAYHGSLTALVFLCFVVLIQNFLTAPLAFIKGEQVPGMPLNGDHDLRSFRVIRTYANSVESLTIFGFTLIVAIFSGVNPVYVNWLVGIHVVFRLAFWLVYYSGVGKAAGGPRTLCFVGGLLSNMVLALLTLVTLLF